MSAHVVKLYYSVAVILGCLCCGGYSTEEWDFLVFTQSWPVTLCIKHAHHSHYPVDECIIPENALQWTIHGLWPNRLDENEPAFCNKSVQFDPKKIEGIRARLQQLWPNLMSDQTADSLWRHEWEKHGTCALDLEALNDEKKYFEKGLDLYGLYNMTSLLPSLNIFPEKDKEYSVVHIINVLRKKMTKAPYIACFKKGGSNYLSEVRLCLDKNFQLIDCIAIHGDHSLTNCPENSTIIYPKNVRRDGSD